MCVCVLIHFVQILSLNFLILQVEAATDSETDSKGLPQYHSVGIQVEDEKR